jgi:hypothetical protein
MVRERVVAALERRFEAPVSVGDLDFDFDGIDIRGVEIGDADGLLRLEHVTVELAPGLPWSGRAQVEGVEVRGGEITGGREGLERLAKRLRPGADADDAAEVEGGWLRGRVQATPETLRMEDVVVAVRQDLGKGGEREIRGRLALDARPRERTATVTLGSVELTHESGRVIQARRIAAPLEPGEDGPVAFPLTVELEGLATAVTPRIAVAEVAGTVELADAEVSELGLDLKGGFSDESGEAAEPELWSVTGSVRRDLSAGELVIDMESFELGRVPQVLAKLPVVDSERATAGGRVKVEFGDGLARGSGEVSLEGLNVSHPLLAHDVVRDVGFELAFEGELDPSARRLKLGHTVLTRRGVQLELEGEFVHPPEKEGRRYKARMRVPPVPCQDVLAAIPAQVIPSLDGFVMRGDFDMDVSVDIDYADLDALSLDGSVGLWNCQVTRAPARVSVERLMGGFTHKVTMRDGSPRSVQLYPGSSTYTPLDQISPHMVAAVLTTEDGGFWRHRGFLPSQFEEALRRNLRKGKVAIGASTITMQMVKNVFLTHERTLSRKLQELILTWYVERALSKRRIMEIYLNVIEFGPGIYGITRASDHYFGKQPRELSSLESAYLALMLPTPVRRHVYYCRDELTPRMETKLRRIHGLMHSRGRIDDFEYELWKDAPLVFDPTERGDPERCLAQIDHLLEASAGQKALTGLLAGEDDAGDEPDYVPDYQPPGPTPLPSVDEEPGATPPSPSPEPDPSNPDLEQRPAMDEDLEGARL